MNSQLTAVVEKITNIFSPKKIEYQIHSVSIYLKPLKDEYKQNKKIIKPSVVDFKKEIHEICEKFKTDFSMSVDLEFTEIKDLK